MTGLRSAVSCYDKIFDKASSRSYNLSIRLTPDGLFYSIYDSQSNKYIAFESVLLSGLAEIYDHILNSDLLRSEFNSTVCILPSAKYTIVPKVLFIPEKAADYLSFVHDIQASEKVSAAFLRSNDALVVYACEMGYFELISEYLPSAKVLPAVNATIDLLVPSFRNTPDTVMCLNLNKNDFDLLLMEDGNMIYCNNFSYSTAEDLVYYTIFVIDQLKVNAEKVKTFISGEISVKSDMLRLLKKYIRTVTILNIENQAQVSYALNDINTYNYPDLFNPRLCEL